MTLRTQGHLFDGFRNPDRTIEGPGLQLHYWPDFVGNEQADRWFARLHAEVDWTQDEIRMYGRDVLVPRLSAWYGDEGADYAYSGIPLVLRPWTPLLEAIRDAVQAQCGHAFNSVLLNLYRDGRDSVAWHADDEPELGRHPLIASLSLGQVRTFQLKHRSDRDLERIDLDLEHGSLLLMAGETQAHWVHAIPKRKKPLEPRINLTFRRVIPRDS